MLRPHQGIFLTKVPTAPGGREGGGGSIPDLQRPEPTTKDQKRPCASSPRDTRPRWRTRRGRRGWRRLPHPTPCISPGRRSLCNNWHNCYVEGTQLPTRDGLKYLLAVLRIWSICDQIQPRKKNININTAKWCRHPRNITHYMDKNEWFFI